MSDYYQKTYMSAPSSVRVSEFHMATSDYSDNTIDEAVSNTLSEFKENLAMDVIFVSEFMNGKRVFKYVDVPESNQVIKAGEGDDEEDTWCKLMVDGKLPQLIPDVAQYIGNVKLPEVPFSIGTYLSTPIILKNNKIYGTLCCFSFSANPSVNQQDLENLKAVASVMAYKIEK